MALQSVCDINFLIRNHASKKLELEKELEALGNQVQSLSEKVHAQIDEIKEAEAARIQMVDRYSDCESKVNFLAGCFEAISVSSKQDQAYSDIFIESNELETLKHTTTDQNSRLCTVLREMQSLVAEQHQAHLEQLIEFNNDLKRNLVEADEQILSLSSQISSFSSNASLKDDLETARSRYQQQYNINNDLEASMSLLTGKLNMLNSEYHDKECTTLALREKINQLVQKSAEVAENYIIGITKATEHGERLLTDCSLLQGFIAGVQLRSEICGRELGKLSAESVTQEEYLRTSMNSMQTIMESNGGLLIAIEGIAQAISTGNWYSKDSYSSLKSSCQELEIELQVVRDENEALQEQIQQRQESYESRLRKYELMQSELLAVSSKSNQYHLQKSSLTQRLSELSTELSQQEEINRSINKDVVDIDNSLQQLENEESIIAREINDLDLQLLSILQERDSLNNEIAFLTSQNKSVGDELLSYKDQATMGEISRRKELEQWAQQSITTLTETLTQKLNELQHQLSVEDHLFQEIAVAARDK